MSQALKVNSFQNRCTPISHKYWPTFERKTSIISDFSNSWFGSNCCWRCCSHFPRLPRGDGKGLLLICAWSVDADDSFLGKGTWLPDWSVRGVVVLVIFEADWVNCAADWVPSASDWGTCVDWWVFWAATLINGCGGMWWLSDCCLGRVIVVWWDDNGLDSWTGCFRFGITVLPLTYLVRAIWSFTDILPSLRVNSTSVTCSCNIFIII